MPWEWLSRRLLIERLAGTEECSRYASRTMILDIHALNRFRAAVEDYRRRGDATPDLRSEARHGHPWFGDINAHQWHCIVPAVHHIVARAAEKAEPAREVLRKSASEWMLYPTGVSVRDHKIPQLHRFDVRNFMTTQRVMTWPF